MLHRDFDCRGVELSVTAYHPTLQAFGPVDCTCMYRPVGIRDFAAVPAAQRGSVKGLAIPSPFRQAAVLFRSAQQLLGPPAQRPCVRPLSIKVVRSIGCHRR